jgi:transposase-like protein
MARTKPIQQLTITGFERMFPDDDACKDFLMQHRWPDSVTCPRCGNDKVYALESRPYHWQCHACATKGYRFSLLVGTVFENTNIALRTWFRVIHLMLTSKKGMSALQIHRLIGTGSYRSAWYLCHRIRAAMHDQDFRKLMGIVEVDETYIGGKDKNRHWDKKQHVTGGSLKMTVIGAIARKGNVVCRMIENADTRTLDAFVRKTVSEKVDLVATDDAGGYRKLMDRGYKHGVVAHMNKEYVRGQVHTNNIESFWSVLKRGVVGTYHNVSRKYLPLYLAEFQFRYNNRRNPDIFRAAIARC